MMEWGLIGVILAPIFFIVSVILFIKATRKKQPVWSYKTEKIIGLGGKAPPELKLFFADEPINELYRTLIIFFNRGNEAIRGEDVKRKPTIDFGAPQILREPEVLKLSCPEIEFLPRRMVPFPNSQANESIELDFSFLDHNDGAIVEIWHTQSEPVDCLATIIGVKKIHRVKEFVPFRPLRLSRKDVISLLIAVSVFIAGVLAQVTDKAWSMLAQWVGMWAAVSLFGSVAWVLRYRKFPRWTSGIE